MIPQHCDDSECPNYKSSDPKWILGARMIPTVCTKVSEVDYHMTPHTCTKRNIHGHKPKHSLSTLRISSPPHHHESHHHRRHRLRRQRNSKRMHTQPIHHLSHSSLSSGAVRGSRHTQK